MKKSILIAVAATVVVIFVIAVSCKKDHTRSYVSGITTEDSLRFFKFKANMEKINSFLRIVSAQKHSLEDTLWVQTPDSDPVGIWATPFWGVKREIIYEIGISRLGINKIMLPEHPDGTRLTLRYKQDGSSVDPETDDFFYCFKGLLLTFCEQQNYKLPASDF